jgi:hypothetical protein
MTTIRSWRIDGAALLFFAANLLMVSPVWSVDYLPWQDVPQHLAVSRILLSYHDSAYNFQHYFTKEWLHSPYVLYYVLTTLWGLLLPLKVASAVTVSLGLMGVPYSLRSLLRALDLSEWHAYLVMPLVFATHVQAGFLTYIMAIPLAFWTLSVAVGCAADPTPLRLVALAILCAATYFGHFGPYCLALAGVGFIGLSLLVSGGPNRFVRCLWLAVATIPSTLLALAWMSGEKTGRATLFAALGLADGRAPILPQYRPLSAALQEIPAWLIDTTQGPRDEQVLVATLLLWLVLFAVGYHHGKKSPSHVAVALLAPLCFVLFFVLPTGYGWLWVIAQRFLILGVYLLIVTIPGGSLRVDKAAAALAIALTATQALNLTHAYRAFQGEVGEFASALQAIPKGQRVAGLMFDKTSQYVQLFPFIHFVGYYQVERGGVVMYSFVATDQSPVDFRPEDEPPPLIDGFEWTPEAVDPARDLGWYDYVLVRGGPGLIGAQSDAFQLIYSDPRWRVFKRLSSPYVEQADISHGNETRY